VETLTALKYVRQLPCATASSLLFDHLVGARRVLNMALDQMSVLVEREGNQCNSRRAAGMASRFCRDYRLVAMRVWIRLQV
jgi:hypothetical protein